ncbi:UDP-4-amino-4,6-dideoxy-N-acetyl-beta-L-altrosamine N-acetyltransferase [Campylobacter sp. RM16187]|uniref:UDP-4-amino-4, 6-dideoxy-N-acetyl-beta-L-altrosamine N-acetyltransferase n=1 Tax=Campylobacter sp. RM16187 TaxID=1660063 RepID=UPI0021B4DFD6|nr:UDP-4-amino-4,6-dideoxy-N-acetyl-beta-L-altrosamine N-acetyltransferase [Campylobacter sp. RM16187]QKG30147.1 UDP-4-amino-4,6-dideoxy-beta-L-AltNAc o-acetyltransferase [Campylobacter sp. RM16187]
MPNLINFTKLTREQKMMVFDWRNDERVAKFMRSKNIALNEHLKFIDSLKSASDKLYFLVEENGEFIGVIDFININDNECEFGLYANPNLKNQGSKLMRIIIDYAFYELKVSRLNSCAYNFNEKAIALYEKFGFEIYDKDEQMSHLRLERANLEVKTI